MNQRLEQMERRNATLEEELVEKTAAKIGSEFEYLKERLTPEFFQRFDKAMNTLSTLHYDLEVIKIQSTHTATLKDVEEVDHKF